MRKWLINNPFAVLLVPLIAYILSCTYWHWPWTIDAVAPLPKAESDTTRAFYPIVLSTPSQERTRTYRYEATILTDAGSRPNVLVYLSCDSTMLLPSMGDTLLVYTVWQQPDSLGSFDYATYLRRQDISGTGFVQRWDWQVIGANRTPWWQSSEGWQCRLLERYQALGISGRELGTISALTLGYREDLEPKVRRQFSAAGAMHVLAVSGLHTGILMTVLLALLTLFRLYKPMYKGTIHRIIIGLIVMLALIAYAWLTGSTPSVVRSVVMACMVLLAMMFHRENQMLNAVFAAAFFILLFRPMDLFSVSFQLSFAAVFSIAFFAPGWKRVMPRNYFLGLIGMTLAALIGTMPVTLHYYGQLNNYFLLTNLIVIPLAWCMMAGGLLTLTIGWITPIGKALAWVVNGVTWVMNESVGWIESLPYSTTMVAMPVWGTWALVGINIAIIIMWDRLTQPVLTWK